MSRLFGFSLLTILVCPAAFAVSVASPKPTSVCEVRTEGLRASAKKHFAVLWKDIDNSVGVEFFMYVLKEHDRMPASELSDAEYYSQLLRNMKKTSKEFATQGLKLNQKSVDRLEQIVKDMNANCTQIGRL